MIHTIHKLKILPAFFEPVLNGNKCFEIRKHDRDYKVGDYLVLNEFDNNKFAGRKIAKEITYILQGSKQTKPYGLKKGYSILSIT